MDLSQHCVSLETAKKMKELGWTKQCVFHLKEGAPEIELSKHESIRACDLYMPLASELIEELPNYYKGYPLLISKYKSDYSVEYGYTARGIGPIISNKSLTEALALLWISLKEQHLI